MASERLERQIEFILEVDRLKSVMRRSYLLNGERHENSAEHSWHLAMMAMVLAEHASEPVDVCRVVMMVLIHDVVEIDAGDTFVYDAAANGGKAEREARAAARIYGLLPGDQGRELLELWREFEAAETADARFAAALDRMMPILHNVHTGGRAWREHGITAEQVLSLNARMGRGSETLWAYVRGLIGRAVADGVLPAGPPPEA